MKRSIIFLIVLIALCSSSYLVQAVEREFYMSVRIDAANDTVSYSSVYTDSEESQNLTTQILLELGFNPEKLERGQYDEFLIRGAIGKEGLFRCKYILPTAKIATVLQREGVEKLKVSMRSENALLYRVNDYSTTVEITNTMVNAEDHVEYMIFQGYMKVFKWYSFALSVFTFAFLMCKEYWNKRELTGVVVFGGLLAFFNLTLLLLEYPSVYESVAFFLGGISVKYSTIFWVAQIVIWLPVLVIAWVGISVVYWYGRRLGKFRTSSVLRLIDVQWSKKILFNLFKIYCLLGLLIIVVTWILI